MKLSAKFIRYIFVGGLAACVDLGLFLALLGTGSPLVPTAIVSFLVAAVVNYRLSAWFVFAVPASARAFGRFMLFAVLGLTINAGVTVLGVQAAGLPAGIAKIAGIGIAFIFNFLCNALIVFRPLR